MSTAATAVATPTRRRARLGALLLALCAALATPAVAGAAEGQPGLIAQTVSTVTQAAGSTVSQSTAAAAQTVDAVAAGPAAADTPPPAQDVAGVVESTTTTLTAAKTSTAKVVHGTVKKVTRDVGAVTNTATKTVAGVTRTAKDAVSTVTEPASGALQIAPAVVAETTTAVERTTGGNAETMVAEPGNSAPAQPAAPEVERGTAGAVPALPSVTSEWTPLAAGATTQAPGFFGALLIDDPPLIAGVEPADRAGSRRAANAHRPFPLDLPGGPLDGLLTSMSAGGGAPAIPPVFAALVAAFLLAAFGPGRLLRPDSALLRPPLQLSALERPG